MDQGRRCWVLLLLITGCGRTALDEPGTNSLARRGGVSAGMVAIGGAFPSGDTGGTGGTATASSPLGMPCTQDQDCAGDAICCDGSAQTCDGTMLPRGDAANPGELVVSADKLTVTDTITGLVWQRDGSGTRIGCRGSGLLTCTWDQAKAYCASLSLAGVSGWRLPARMELFTILDLTGMPAIDPKAFPITPADITFWTSSPGADSSNLGWEISCATGILSVGDGADYNKVRCVRGARCYPRSRFAVLDGSLVRDTLTGLVWQQVASPTEMTWLDAQSYCATLGSGFRLPTVKELQSIVDLTVAPPNPTIDTTAFPNTPGAADAFWTSTPTFNSPSAAWQIFFGSGVSSIEDAGSRHWVRCVR